MRWRRYQVVTWSRDIGTDEQMDFTSMAAAVKDAKSYKGVEEYAAVFDKDKLKAYVVFGESSTLVFADHVVVREW